MNLPSDARGTQQALSAGTSGVEPLTALLVQGNSVSPFEFRALTGEDMEAGGAAPGSWMRRQSSVRGSGQRAGDNGSTAGGERYMGSGFDCAEREAALRSAVEAARRDGLQQGEREGRRAARVEMEAELRASVAQERQRLVAAAEEFRGAREQYFTNVEQEVVKLALAIAARVLHREAQIDPLLLTGVVRVALEKMADRSGVVLRVAGEDVEAWERVFSTAEASERPRVMEDARLERGECVLETRMGTVELGVSVQLEEIEKGFFDLLNHRPVE
jgi:flagellar assembly protein FliH